MEKLFYKIIDIVFGRAKIFLQVGAIVQLIFAVGCSIGDTTLTGNFMGALKSTAALSLENNLHFQIPEDAQTQFVMKLSDPVDKDTRVDWVIFPDGGGDASSDFTAISGTSTIPKGEISYSVALPINDDNLYEGNEIFRWVFISYSEHLTVDIEQYNFTIIDNEPVPTLSLSSGSSQFNEADGSVTVGVIVNPPSAFPVDISYTVGGSALGAGDDYDNFVAGNLNIAAGNATANFNIDLVDDATDETDETIVINLTGALVDGSIVATLAAPNAHALTIVDNENAILSITDSNPYDFGNVSVNGSSTYSFTLSNAGAGAATALADSLGLSAPFEFLDGTYPGNGGNCGGALAAGGSCVLVVEFAPTATGSFSDDIELSYFDGMDSQSIVHGVQGNGASGAVLTISDAATYDYGLTENSTTKDHSFTITNTGGSPASSIAYSGLAAPYDYKDSVFPGTGGDCGATLAGGATCTLVISFSPSASGAYPEQLVVDYDSGTGMSQVTRDIAGVGASPFTWTGLGVDSNWATAGNWLGGSAPGVSDVAVFDQYCTNCNATVNASISIAGAEMKTGYTGTITQASGASITIGASGWTQQVGTFVGGDSDFVLSDAPGGNFSLSGGSFTGPNALFKPLNGFSISGGSFTASPTTHLGGLGGGIINIGASELNDVEFLEAIILTGTLKVNGDLLINASGTAVINGGTIEVAGNVNVTNQNGGTSLLKFVGTSNSTLTVANGEKINKLELAMGAAQTLTVAGDFSACGGFTYTSGILNATGSTIDFTCVGGVSMNAGSAHFDSVKFSENTTITGFLNIDGDLTLNGSYALNAGEVLVAGNVTSSSWSQGTSAMTFNGAGLQTITSSAVSELPTSAFKIDKASGTVVLANAISLNGAGQDLNILDGDLDLNGFDLTVNDQLNVGDGSGAASSARILKACSTITAGTQTVNPTDGEIVGSSSNPNITISDATVAEGGNLVFNVALSEGVCATDFTVNYSISNGTTTAADYATPANDSDATPADGILTLSSGATSGTVTIATTTDANMEMDEYLIVVLSVNSHGTFVDDTGRGVIENDDDNGYIWTGDAGDGDFHNGANWSNGVTAPGNTNVVLFDDVCADVPSNCDVLVSNGNVDVQGFWINESYAGTITQGAGRTIKVGNSYFEQRGGTFVGGDSTIDVDRFYMKAGTFISTTGELRVGQVSVAGGGQLSVTGGAFDNNSGTVRMDGQIWDVNPVRVGELTAPSGLTLNNLIIDAHDTETGSGADDAYVVIANGTTIHVDGDLTIRDGFIGGVNMGIYPGNIYLKGNFYQLDVSSSIRSEVVQLGYDIVPPIVYFDSGGSQEYSGTSNTRGPRITVTNGSVVTPAAGTTDVGFSSFALLSGSFQAPSGTMKLGYNTSSDADMLSGWTHTGGIFDHNFGTIKFDSNGYFNNPRNGCTVNSPSGTTFYNLHIAVRDYASDSGYNGAEFDWSAASPLTVLNDLIVTDGVVKAGGSFIVGRDVRLNYTNAQIHAEGFSAGLTFNGASDAAIEVQLGASGFSTSLNVEKDSTSTTTMLSDINLSSAGLDLNLDSGTLDINGHNLTVNDQLNVGDGVGAASSARILKDCNTITAGTQTVNPTDGEIVGSGSNPNITISDATVLEGGNLVFNVTLSEGVCGSATNITFTTDNGTAVAGSDYTDNDSTLVIAAGDTSGTITVVTADDGTGVAGTMEFDETLYINLTGTDQGAITDSQGIGTILNEDDNGYIWMGRTDSDWNTGANWSGSAVPPTDGSVVVAFTGACQAEATCNAVTAGNVDVKGMWLYGSYVGTITQSPGNTVDVGTDRWIQNSGIFSGGSSPIQIAEYVLSGGVFTSTSGSLTVGYDLPLNTSNADGFTVSGGTFNHNSGTLEFKNQALINDATWRPQVVVDVSGSLELNDVVVDINNSVGQFSHASVDIAVGNTLVVNGDLTIHNGYLREGQIDLKGDLILNCASGPGVNLCAEGGTTVITMTGGSPQEYTHQVGAFAPFLVINSSSTVGPSAGTSTLGVFEFTLQSGGFTAPTGLMEVGYKMPNTTANTNGFTVSGGTYNHNGGTLEFLGEMWNAGSTVRPVTVVDVPGSLTLNDLVVDIKDTSGANSNVSVEIAAGDTLVVQGDLTINDGQLIGQTIDLKGNLIINCADGFDGNSCAEGGTTIILMTGASPQEYTHEPGGFVPTLHINSTSTVSPALGITSLGVWKFVLQSGTFSAPAGTMQVGYRMSNNASNADGFTVLGGTFNHSSGTLEFLGNEWSGSSMASVTTIDVASSLDVYNLIVNVADTSGDFDDVSVDITAGDTIVVNGDLTIENGYLKDGVIDLKGNLQINCDDGPSGNLCAQGGTTELHFTGPGDQNISIASNATAPGGVFTVSKSSGDVVQLSSVNLSAAGQDLLIYDGDWNMAGYDLTVNDQLNVGDGVGAASSARILKDCNTITAGTQTVNPTDGEIVGSGNNPDITISDASVLEGGNLVFNVSLSEGVCATDFSVNYSINDGTATTANSDYAVPATDSDAAPNDGVLTLSGGATSGTITVASTADATMEIDENMTVVLDTPSHGALTDNTGVGVIENDDDNGYIWTGDAGDSNFSNGANWSNGTLAPGPGDIVLFDDICSDVPANCDVETTASVSITGIMFNNDYPGTFTQNSGHQISTINRWLQDGGTFVGGDSNVTVQSSFQLLNGSFTSTSATLAVDYGTNRTHIFGNTANFTHNNGKLRFYTNNSTSDNVITLNRNIDLYDLEFIRTSSGGSYTHWNFNSTGVFNVTNDLYYTRTLAGGLSLTGSSIEVKGDIFAGGGYHSGAPKITTVVKLNGTADQYYNYTSGVFPRLNIEKVSGSVLPEVGTTALEVTSLRLLQGTFTAPTGTLSIFSRDGNQIQIDAGTTFNHNNGNLRLRFEGAGGSTGTVNLASDLNLYDMQVSRGNSGTGSQTIQISGGNIHLIDDLLLTAHTGTGPFKLNGGKIFVGGDMTVETPYSGGSTQIEFDGPGDQTASVISGSLPQGTFTINKFSGSVLLGSALNLGGTGQDLSILNGDFLLNGYDLTVNDQLNVGDGVGAANSARILKDCNTITAGAQNVNPTDGVIEGSSSNPNITISDASVLEGGNLVFNVALSEGVCATDFTVNYSVADGTATTANLDYSTPATDSDATPNDGILTISGGGTSGTITVATTADATMELDETINVSINSASHGSITDSSAVGVIENDDDNGYIWTGDTGNGSLSDGANWSNGSTAPGPGVVVMFNDTCSDVPVNCDAVTTSNFSVAGILMASNYAGTITQDLGHSITVGTSGWTMEGGTFDGGNSQIAVGDSNLEILGGVFTSTQGQLRLTYNQAPGGIGSATPLKITGGVFNHNSGTLYADGKKNGTNFAYNMDVPFDQAFYNFTLDNTYNRIGYFRIIGGGQIRVLNNLKFSTTAGNVGATFDTGTIVHEGPKIISDRADYAYQIGHGDGLVKIAGSSNQKFETLNNGYFPRLQYDSPGNSLSPEVGTTELNAISLDIQNGNFVGPNTISLGKTNFYGEVPFQISATGDFDETAVNEFNLVGASNGSNKTNSISIAEDVYIPTLNITGIDASGGTRTTFHTFSGVGKFNVTNQLNITSSALDKEAINGNLYVQGHINIDGVSTSGTGTITLNGGGDQNFTQINGGGFDHIIVDKLGGEVVQQTAVSIGAKNLTIVNGDWEMNNFDFTTTGTVDVGDGIGAASTARILKGCSTITAGTQNVSPTDGEIVVSGSNPNVTISNESVTEGGALVFDVNLSEAVCGGNFTVNYAVVDGTATLADSDYSGTPTDSDGAPSDGTLTLASGVSTGTVSIATISDGTKEFNEKLYVNLSSNSHGTITVAQGTGTIVDDDGAAGPAMVNIASPLNTDFIVAGNQAALPVQGYCTESGLTVTISANDTNGGTAAVTPTTQPTCTSGEYSTTLDVSSLDDDTITITADHDSATQASVSLLKLTSPPSVAITSPLASDYIAISNESTFTVSGTCSANGQEVTIGAYDANGATSAVAPGVQPTCAGGSFSVSINLSSLDDGTITIVADHQDAAANVAPQSSVSLVKDTVAPDAMDSITLYSDLTGSISSTLSYTPDITLAFSGSDVGTGVDHYEYQIEEAVGGVVQGWTSIASLAPFRVSGLSLVDATNYLVKVRVVDAAGNESSPLSSAQWLTQQVISVYDGQGLSDPTTLSDNSVSGNISSLTYNRAAPYSGKTLTVNNTIGRSAGPMSLFFYADVLDFSYGSKVNASGSPGTSVGGSAGGAGGAGASGGAGGGGGGSPGGTRGTPGTNGASGTSGSGGSTGGGGSGGAGYGAISDGYNYGNGGDGQSFSGFTGGIGVSGMGGAGAAWDGTCCGYGGGPGSGGSGGLIVAAANRISGTARLNVAGGNGGIHTYTGIRTSGGGGGGVIWLAAKEYSGNLATNTLGGQGDYYNRGGSGQAKIYQVNGDGSLTLRRVQDTWTDDSVASEKGLPMVISELPDVTTLGGAVSDQSVGASISTNNYSHANPFVARNLTFSNSTVSYGSNNIARIYLYADQVDFGAGTTLSANGENGADNSGPGGDGADGGGGGSNGGGGGAGKMGGGDPGTNGGKGGSLTISAKVGQGVSGRNPGKPALRFPAYFEESYLDDTFDYGMGGNGGKGDGTNAGVGGAGTPSAGGGGGGGEGICCSTGGAGGGGGGGGLVVIIANNIIGTGAVNAKGGNGGMRSFGDVCGGGGGGGVVWIAAKSYSGGLSANVTGGTSCGSGVAGQTGSAKIFKLNNDGSLEEKTFGESW